MPRRADEGGWLLPMAVLALAIVIGLAPLGMAMGVVLVCAGPHNWCEARYFLSRMPGRWGPLAPFFATAMGGVLVLTLGFVAMSAWATWSGPEHDTDILLALSCWHTAVIAWVAALTVLRQRERGGPVAGWLPPVAFLAVAGAWAAPLWSSVVLVYLHPLLSLVFLDRELAVRRSPWRRSYRTAVAVVPLAIVGVWIGVPTADAATLARPEALQAGTFLLPPAAAAPLLATHVLLETLHYGVWILAMPLATAALPWHLRAVPLTHRSTGWRTALRTLLAAGALAVLALWILFAIDYETTRQAYFTLAIAHVLAEVPFLLRLR